MAFQAKNSKLSDDGDLFKQIVTDMAPRNDFDIATELHKTAKLNFGNWNNPLTPISDSHRKVIQPILDATNRKKAWYDLAEAYMTQDGEFRLVVSKYWDFGVDWAWCLPPSAAGEPVSVLTKVRADLIYYSIAVRHSEDIRDNLVGIAHAWHLCDANGYNADEVFRDVANVSLPIIGRLLLNFVEHSPENKSLKAFGLKTVTTPDGSLGIESEF